MIPWHHISKVHLAGGQMHFLYHVVVLVDKPCLARFTS